MTSPTQQTTEPKFSVGQIVASWNSGLAYKIVEAYALDMCGSYAYAVRGWRGGRFYGPTRRIAECRLVDQPTANPTR